MHIDNLYLHILFLRLFKLVSFHGLKPQSFFLLRLLKKAIVDLGGQLFSYLVLNIYKSLTDKFTG
jgi:hypothetical protein